MRRRVAASLSAVLVLTATAACGSEKKDAPASSDVSGVTVTGDFGKEPKVEVAKSFSVSEVKTANPIAGDGDTVEKDSVITARAAIYDSDGKLVQGNFGENDPQQIDLSQASGPAIEALIGQKAGSRVEIAAPVKEIAGPQGAPQAGLDPDESMLFVFDIVEILPPLPTGPEGEEVEPPADAPKVESDGDKVTGIDFSDAPSKAPTTFEAIPLVEGTGPAVKENTSISVNYYGAVWGEKEPFDSSFDRGQAASFTLAKGSLIDGWVKGLVGVKQGSRVMLVIPADLGYGAKGSPPKIPGGATLVFVIDVLRAG